MKTYLINDCSKGIMADYIEIRACSPKKAAERYLFNAVKRLYHSKGDTHGTEITVREGRIEDGEEIFKFGASLFLYEKENE